MTFLARNQHVGQEIHLNGLVAVAVTCLAASAGDIERETSGLVAADFRFGQIYKEVAYIGKNAGICRRIGTRRTAERRLVDSDNLIDIVNALNRLIRQRLLQ